MGKIYRQAVLAIIVNTDNKILMGYSPRDKSYKFPQGGLEENEGIIEGLERELLEELDYQLKPAYILAVYAEKINYPFPPDSHPIFKGQELSIVKIKYDPTANIIPQDDEFDTMLWINPLELKNYNSAYRSEAYIKALKICQLI